MSSQDSMSAPVESVDRALRLLIYLRENDSISVKEAAEHLDIAASTAHRLLSTLARRDFVVQDFSRRYRLGRMVLGTEKSIISEADLRAAAMDPMTRLQQAVRETVQVMVLKGGNIRFVDGVEPDTILRVTRRAGDEMPAFVSSGGKVILGRLSNQEVEEIYRRGLIEWPTRKVTSLKMLKRMLTQVRRNGYALSVEETEQGVVGVGVCILGKDARPLGALTLAIPVSRFDRNRLTEYVEGLKTAVAEVEATLLSS
ncbi:IclR family transcriptional regulator [Corynebacterium crudilactis]|uniref:IclR family transcriptional regulator n=1 Tax=Corynebacterium crudilactis TaxID=1652495 RepID=A0A172QWT1_9CORY|nr:IclR family transcriptional regulator [Corynebacterium crudilactis]ANE05167.1 IclR family transcriptional regulator [Corynebacterium crudilactis]